MAIRRPHITIYKEHAWPPAAPRPRVLHDRAIELANRINTALIAEQSHRVIDRVVVNANQRISVSIRGKTDGRYTLRTHWMLMSEEKFRSAVLKAVQHGTFPKDFNRIFDALRDRVTSEHLYTDQRKGKLTTEGTHVDLRETLARVAQYLPPDEHHEGVKITWGKRPSTPSRRSIRLGSMDEKRSLIRVHPVLDSAWVPAVVVDFVVWHELCHYVRPPLDRDLAAATSDHRVHHRAFRALEARFPQMETAETWIRRHIDILLRGAPSPKKSDRAQP